MEVVPEHRDSRFPRPCRFVARRFVFTCQFAVGETLAADLGHSQSEALRIAHVFAVIETEHLFVKVAIEMVRLNTYIRSMKGTLNQRPEVFNRVRVDLAAHILNRMVDYFMLVMLVEANVRLERIGVERSASLDMFPNQGLHIELAALVNDLCANSAAALHESHDYGFIIVNAASQFSLAALVHVPSFAADECFVNFYAFATAAQLRGIELVLHRKPQALKHEPCRLLGNAKRAVNLHAGNAILAIAEHPESSHPLVESDRRIFEDRPDFKRELFLAGLAKPDEPSANEPMVFAAAARANHLAVREAKIDGEHKSTLGIGEVNDGLLKCFRLFHVKDFK